MKGVFKKPVKGSLQNLFFLSSESLFLNKCLTMHTLSFTELTCHEVRSSWKEKIASKLRQKWNFVSLALKHTAYASYISFIKFILICLRYVYYIERYIYVYSTLTASVVRERRGTLVPRCCFIKPFVGKCGFFSNNILFLISRDNWAVPGNV